jgi:hypothetical protein
MRNSLLQKSIIALASLLFLSSCVVSESSKESSASTGETEKSSTTSTTTKTSTNNDGSTSTGETTGGTKTSTSTSTGSTSSIETGGSEIEDDDDEKTSTGGSKSSSSSSKTATSYVLTPSLLGLTTTSSSKDDYLVTSSNIEVSYENLYSSNTDIVFSSYASYHNTGSLKLEAPHNYLFVGIKFSFPTNYTYTSALRYEVGDSRYTIDATYSSTGFSRSYALKDDIDEIELSNLVTNVIALTSLEVIMMGK